MEVHELKSWFAQHEVDDVGLLIPDMSGAVRGKSMTASLFLNGIETGGLRIPESVFSINLQGETVFNDHIRHTENDLFLKPDLNTTHLEPWNADPTACFICDTYRQSGQAYELAPRTILKNVLSLYAEQGWTPVVGPEIEFYLIAKFDETILEPESPLGRSGMRDYGQHVLSLDAIDDFAPLFDDLYKYCEIQNIGIETLIHEDGPCQFEVNIHHGDALLMADQLYLFKRLMRQVALNHDMFVTFMAKPYSEESGSSIHLHQSVIDAKTGKNIFSTEDGSDTDLFLSHIGGLQTYLPEALPLLAPYTNSYNRFEAYMSAPTNTHWSRENRTVGFRVPSTSPSARRVENRIAGSDINPYLAIAASLLCGYIGMVEKRAPREEYIGEGYTNRDHRLPLSLLLSLENLEKSSAMRKYLGDSFVETFAFIKRTEHEHRAGMLSPWDVRYLITNV
ncbi:MAG: glutamine synthetase family protein [Pseudomonadota bacterium]